MKNGKKLTLEEKIFLSKQGYNPEDFLRTKKNAYDYEFLQVSTGKLLIIRR